MGSNLRAQSVQNRSYELIESRPVTNLELVTGRLMSFMALASIAVIFATVAICLHGSIDVVFGFGYGDLPELWSVLAFIIWDIVPNLAFWGAFAVFLTMLTGSRLAGAIFACVIYLGWCVFTLGLPLEVIEEPFRVPTVTFLIQAAPIFPYWLLEPLQSFSAAAMYPSELAPTFMSLPLVGQRLAMLLLATALVCNTAVFYPRSQESRKIGSILGITCVVLATTLLGLMSYRAWLGTEQSAQWAETHVHLEVSETFDLEHITGSVELRPNNFMSLDLTLRLRTLDTLQAEAGVFAFNPGFRVNELWLNGTEVFDYEFQDGLLTVPWDSKTSIAELRVLARGKPDESFAYMDASINVARLNGKQLRRLRNLGTESSIFHSDYVALLPGVHWYPTLGAATGRENLDETKADFHTFDLEITTNRNWLVAAVGQRERLPDSSRDTYRIHSSVPVPSIAIVSSKFVRRAISAEGVEFELLISPRHADKLEHLAGLEVDLQEWLTERLAHAKTLGLKYPYKRFTVAEAPSNLRIFGGGWQMDSTLGPPGLFLVRESGMLSTRLEREEYRRWNEHEQRKTYTLSPLLNKIKLDIAGDNPYLSFSKNFLTNITKPTGSGATALEFVLDRLIAELVLQHGTYFSIRDLLTRELYDVYSSLWLGKDFAGKYFDQPSVWFTSEMISLSELDQLPDQNMRNRVLWHKGHALLRTMRDAYGSDGLRTIFRDLLEQHRGGNFSFEELIALAPMDYETMNGAIRNFLFTTHAPGYIATQPLVSHIRTPEDTNKYLTSFVLFNGEEAPGFVQVYNGATPPYRLEGDGALTEPIWFEAKQAHTIALRSEKALWAIWIKPYFSHNRDYLVLYPDLPNDQTQTIQKFDIPISVQPTDWQPSASNSDVIVVDDLDVGFSIVFNANLEKVEPKQPINTNQESSGFLVPSQYYLPQSPEDIRANEWHREVDDRSIGKYQPTLVRIRNGRGLTSARFEATLPQQGRWRLDYHVTTNAEIEHEYVRYWYEVPFITRRKYTVGNIAITVQNGNDQSTTELSVVESEYEWKNVGYFEITEENVAVLVSDAVVGTKGNTVYVDAIRWTFADEEPAVEPTQE